MRLAAIALIVAGCSFRPRPATSGDGGDDDAAVPEDAGADAGVATACASPGAIQDTFPGTMLSPQWYAYMSSGGSMVSVAANNAVLKVGTGSNAGAAIYSRHDVDLTGGVAEVEVTAVVGGSGTTGFYAGLSGTHFVGITEANGNLTTLLVDGATNTGSSTPFDSAMMKYWQLHEHAGSVAFETSPDGVTWTAQTSAVPTPTWISDVELTLSAFGSAGTAQFANVDTLQPSAPWCTADQLHDTFQAGDLQWYGAAPTGKACTYVLSGDAIIGLDTGATCELGTSRAWDLTGHAIVVKWGAMTPAPSGSFSPVIALQPDMGMAWAIYITGTQICGPMPNMGCVNYTFDPTGQDRYWQLAESGGMLTVSSSPDGATWSTVHMVPDPFTPLVGEIELGVMATGGAQTDAITFDAVN